MTTGIRSSEVMSRLLRRAYEQDRAVAWADAMGYLSATKDMVSDVALCRIKGAYELDGLTEASAKGSTWNWSVAQDYLQLLGMA